jgi:hypothetical protein
MSSRRPQGTPAPEGHHWMYWGVGAVVLALVVIGLITYSGKKETQQAQDKAAQLTQSFQQAGLRVPEDQETITRSFGTDGGAVCDNPASALGKAVLFDTLANGASFVGHRPVIVDRDVLKGEALILQTYCPDKLEQYRKKIEDKVKVDDVLKD